MTYQVIDFYGISEKDSYDRGLSGSSRFMSCDIKVYGETIKEVIDNIKCEFSVETESIEFDACEEEGRIDIQRLENSGGYQASETEIEGWKKGKINLYLVTYTGTLEQTKVIKWDQDK